MVPHYWSRFLTPSRPSGFRPGDHFRGNGAGPDTWRRGARSGGTCYLLTVSDAALATTGKRREATQVGSREQELLLTRANGGDRLGTIPIPMSSATATLV